MSVIEWNTWGRAAFERAARERKPVLLSLVAAWSAACGDMDRVAFADPAVGALVAGRFVPVRVDADRRPDINERYNLGGCPTTAFLTPAGDILWGATYLDVEPLRNALDRISGAFAADRDAIEERAALDRLEVPALPPPLAPNPGLDDWIAAQAAAALDPARVGSSGVPTEPPDPAALLFLLRRAAGRDDPALRDVVSWWAGNLSDDVMWERAEDNAALLIFLVEAAAAFRDVRVEARAREVARQLRALVSSGGIMCVDVISAVLEACAAASAIDPDGTMVPFVVDALERTVGATYRPGEAVGHLVDAPDEVRGLLVDQVRAASALLTVYGITNRLPYAMLAEELMQWTHRHLRDERGGLLDRVDTGSSIGLLARQVRPFGTNCDAARVLCRLAALHDDERYRGAAVLAPGADYRADARRVLGSQTALVPEYGALAAPYGLALAECADRGAAGG
ncbi:MAG: DUF255 domain-containing protein [Betaproteobacteria bacterium]